MHLLKHTIRWLLGIAASLYLLVQAVMILPPVQREAASLLCQCCSNLWSWDIKADRLQLGLGNRIILDNVTLNDKTGAEMLHASRLAAKIDILPLFRKRISIANAQIFGTQAHLRQDKPGEAPNYQFIIDSFKSDSKQESPLNLHIGTLLLRHVDVSWDRTWKPVKDTQTIDPDHLSIKDLALTAHLRHATSQSLKLTVKRLEFKEKSGFQLRRLRFKLRSDNKGLDLEDLEAALPHTILRIPTLKAQWRTLPGNDTLAQWLGTIKWNMHAYGHIDPNDLTTLTRLPHELIIPYHIDIQAEGSDGQATIKPSSISCDLFTLKASATLRHIFTTPKADIRLLSLHTTSGIFHHDIIDNIGSSDTNGAIFLSSHDQAINLKTTTDVLTASLDIKMKDWNQIDATISTNTFNLAKLIGNPHTIPVTDIQIEAKAHGYTKGSDNHPELEVEARLPHLTLYGHEYPNTHLSASCKSDRLTTNANLNDPDGVLDAAISINLAPTKSLTADIHIQKLAIQQLNITNKLPNSRLSANVKAALTGTHLDDIQGHLNIQDFTLTDYAGDTELIPHQDLTLASAQDGTGRHLTCTSDFLNIDASGNFKFTTLPQTLQGILSASIPDIAHAKPLPTHDTIKFEVTLQDTTILRTLTNQDILIPQRLTATGNIDGPHKQAILETHIPAITINGKKLKDTKIDLCTHDTDETQLNLATTLATRKSDITINTDLRLADNRLRLKIDADNNKQPSYRGEVTLTGTLEKTAAGTTATRLWIAPSRLIISDKEWNVHPSTINHSNGVTHISHFKISQDQDHSICIDGKLSKAQQDSLTLALANVDIEYILNIVNFHSVDFGGQLSGKVTAYGALSDAKAHGHLDIDEFTFNHAPQGNLSTHITWGDEPHQLTLDGNIHDTTRDAHSHLHGTFTIGDKKHNGLDLHIATQRFNLAFLNRFTRGIINDIEGTVDGTVRIHGDFKHIDLTGKMLVTQATANLPMLGTDYTLTSDSVTLSPGTIAIKGDIKDKHSNTAHLDGRILHRNFKNIKYQFSLDMNNFLGYNQNDFGDNAFKATVFATGRARLDGESGRTTVDIDATTQRGTTFTYNVALPEAITNTPYIKYKAPSGKATPHPVTADIIHVPADIFLNLNLHMTPGARIELLMNQQSGERIELQGSGTLFAKYHNKGRFQMFGTYRTSEGYYRLNIRDVLHRDFRFMPDGTIIFGGDPMLATLNLRGIYSVPNVSIDDLSSTSMGFSKSQVDCIMMLTGQPSSPQVTFDFDLPNAAEDERQMVRSMVSTEEERNMQAVYLLAMGRFFNYSSTSTSGQNQSVTAVNSLVSTTLSSQLNQFISNATGTSKWNFGANFKTGDDGWKNMDVEGMLSGTMFNDRLVINGNFGYREKYYTQHNFIGDVTVQYLITKNGGISLKAFNKANDRYFVQSSLNTQGIGVQFKKDFNNLAEFFRWKRKRKP